MNKLTPDLPKNDPADECVAEKVALLLSWHTVTKLIYVKLGLERSEPLEEGSKKIDRVLYVV